MVWFPPPTTSLLERGYEPEAAYGSLAGFTVSDGIIWAQANHTPQRGRMSTDEGQPPDFTAKLEALSLDGRLLGSVELESVTVESPLMPLRDDLWYQPQDDLFKTIVVYRATLLGR